MSEKQTHMASSGVEALIERLKNEGVAAGQEKAEDLVLNAQKRAAWIIEEAELEAKAIKQDAEIAADELTAAGKDALQLASRDALIKLQDTLLGSFSQEVKRVVGEQMRDDQFTEKLILALAGIVREKTALDQQEHVLIKLPEDVLGVEELRKNPEELEQGQLSQYTASLAADLLRKGVRFEISEDLEAGLKVHLVDNAMEIDFSDNVVAELLLQHLQPRFRALLQGIVK